jgi:hypothetical protein
VCVRALSALVRASVVCLCVCVCVSIRNRTIVDQLFSEEWLSDITSKQIDGSLDPFPQDLLAALLVAYQQYAADLKNTLPTDRDIAVRLLAKWCVLGVVLLAHACWG